MSGHVCSGPDCCDDEPSVVGLWLQFLDIDHDGWVHVPLDRVVRMQSCDKYLDVVYAYDNQDQAGSTQTWDRIYTPRAEAIAADVIRALGASS